ncbi:hypothetical protein A3G63_03030 [Candidatus Kaiserbacteria bacterium RIFCSPLOWO2_12_FULL_52_8]|uniref:Transglycosylase SLT domain-containing protein n=1 Tax=Candidatus Kaiserbacteria bacterium RIFCSPHIGHO2_01_FULL_53_31 TaxID=1798481 RepID=A0A1F6CJD2_9BACT|nr:MAG: hypothetical protein A2678_01345 [Candidatus Kaiserbacteria bacterium RIFCSPHIGHO2_01_FULL_53_31]OGG94566.1 MAG: hypothetical protein A3G63_03030 [Candidatus Kaiserbacteria bacterium RIFCSPLOWO2_12_FULL_52_8]
MRSRVSLFIYLLVIVAAVVPSVTHAAIPFFGPIIPEAQALCPGSWALVITVLNNIIAFAITAVIIFVAPLMLAYAGFLYVANPVSPGGISKAKDVLFNTIGGTIVALAAWLIIAAIMAVLYDPSAVGKTWQSLVTARSNDALCIDIAGSLNQVVPGTYVTGIDAGSGQFLTLPTSGDCQAGNLMDATAGSPYALNQEQANTLSCIAVPESRCGARTTGARTPEGKPTSASGMFQIVFGSGNDTCHNLNIPACSQAAGVSGNLNCYQQFSGGSPKRDSKGNITAAAAACQRAAANVTCNAQAAACLVKADKGFSAWTADRRAATQRNCITQYASLR